MSLRRRQQGVALLAAILLVAVGTILAATIAFQSAMAARRGIASLSFEQSALVAEGAEALAGYALHEDDGKTDTLTDSWASPFGPTEIMPGVVLEAAVEDLQGRFNLNSLVDNQGKPDAEMVEAFRVLLELVELEPKWAEQIADWIDQDVNTMGVYGLEDGGTTGQDPPYRTANTLITSPTELFALPGFGRERYLKLAPYVTALPPHTTLNVCTAPGQVLDAMLGEGIRNYADLEQLANSRKKGCSPELQHYLDIVESDKRMMSPNPAAKQKFKERFGDKSEHFRLTSLITLGGSEFALYSLLKRDQGGAGKVRVVQRSFTPD